MSQPAAIDGLAFARNASQVAGRFDLDSMPRLAQSGCSEAALGFVLKGETSQHGKPQLGLVVDGSVRLECQRCLERLELPLNFEVKLELATSEAEIAAGDEEDDIDRILAGREMNLAALVEEEVLLALPMVPRHERCEAAMVGAGNSKPSSFQGLAVLRRPNK